MVVEGRVSTASICPDIYLKGERPKVVEIVVTHEPEEGVRQYTETNDIPLVVLSVEAASELESIKDGTLTPVVHWRQRKCPCVVNVATGGSAPCNWRWCDKCQEAFEYGGYGDHRHCVSCGQRTPKANMHGEYGWWRNADGAGFYLR